MSFREMFQFCVLLTILGCQTKEVEKITTRVQDIPEYSSLKDMDSAPEKIKARSAAIMKIGDTHGSSGTAFFVNDQGLLMTNNHVLGAENCARTGCFAELTRGLEVGLKYQEPELVFAVPLLVDVQLDMALFQIKNVTDNGGGDRKVGSTYTSPYHLTFRSASAQSLVGEKMYIVGHPVGALKKWIEGEGLSSSGNWVLSDHFVLPGNSGSPVLDVDGKIVGLLHRTTRGTETITKDNVQATSFFSASQAILEAAGITDFGADTSITILQSKLRPKSADHLLVMKNLEEVTREEFGEYQELFLGAGHTPKFDLESYADLFSEGCDQELERVNYSDVDAHYSALVKKCLAVIEWISCDRHSSPWNSSKSGDPKWCPSETKRNEWIERSGKIMNRLRDLNRGDSLRGQIYVELLSTFTNRSGVDLVNSFVQEAHPPITIPLALLKIRVSRERRDLFIDSTDLPTYIKNYRNIKHFEREYLNLIVAMVGLYNLNKMDSETIRLTLIEALQSSEVTLLQKLWIEVLAFRFGML